MNKVYSLLAVLCIAATSLTSCSRSDYAFNNKVPAYLGSKRVQPVAKPTPVPATTETVADALPTTKVVAATPAPAATSAKALVDTPSLAQATPVAVAAIASVAKVVKPSLVQRVLLRKVVKRLDEGHTIHQNAVNVKHAASKVGSSALVLLAGAVIILIGGLIGGANIVVTIGVIVFIVGLVLLILALVNGK